MVLFVVLWLMTALLTKSIASGEMTCITSITTNGTFYKVPEFGKSDCHQQWNDANDNNLANSEGKNDSLVFFSNISTLHTYGCHNTVMYLLDCYIFTRENKRFTCVANCSESAGFSGTSGKEKGTSNHWLIPVMCTVFIFLVIGVVIYYRRRQRRNQNGL